VSFLRTVFLFVILLSSAASGGDSLSIAVASNFQVTAREIAAEFTAETQVPVRISTGSTGKLYAQIINGAPYDIFLAADAARPKILEETGFAVQGSRMTYATGSLVLWSADAALRNGDCLAALKSGSYRRLAMANPLTAPYGFAAQEFLQAIDVLDAAQKRIVYGENVAQALQFVATGNATLGLVARSQVASDLPVVASCSWQVPPAMHSALDQQAVLLVAGTNNAAAARSFMAFLLTAQVAVLLERHGYTGPLR
jgi:molybdate transport system substrate-binding protein